MVWQELITSTRIQVRKSRDRVRRCRESIAGYKAALAKSDGNLRKSYTLLNQPRQFDGTAIGSRYVSGRA